MKWQPGSSLPNTKLWEKHNKEVSTTITLSLFADDTTILGNREEITTAVREIKEVMGKYEERNNYSKEEDLIFGTEEDGKVRILGS